MILKRKVKSENVLKLKFQLIKCQFKINVNLTIFSSKSNSSKSFKMFLILNSKYLKFTKKMFGTS